MKDIEQNQEHVAVSRKIRKPLLIVIIIIVFFAIIFISLEKYIFTLPDLSNCNRVVIKYEPPPYLFFLMTHTLLEYVLNKEERELVNSFNDTLEVTNMEQIKNFVHDVSKARFNFFGEVIHDLHAYAECYDSNNLLSSFYISNGDIITKYGIKFESRFENTLFLTDILLPPELRPLQLRSRCAFNMLYLYEKILESNYPISYPDPNLWSDIISNAKRSFTYIKDDGILRWLKCPAAGEDKCNYALNPNCEPNSPKDMVLLFETKAGWNQHGGPELFTFDNHNPKGGCVLFNDGSVKFIRTKEELHNLRWK